MLLQQLTLFRYIDRRVCTMYTRSIEIPIFSIAVSEYHRVRRWRYAPPSPHQCLYTTIRPLPIEAQQDLQRKEMSAGHEVTLMQSSPYVAGLRLKSAATRLAGNIIPKDLSKIEHGKHLCVTRR